MSKQTVRQEIKQRIEQREATIEELEHVAAAQAIDMKIAEHNMTAQLRYGARLQTVVKEALNA